MTSLIKALIEKYYDIAVDIRHRLHMYPESGFKEFRTAELILRTLTDYGIEAKGGIAKTGIVANVNGYVIGKTVLLRADMDGLEIEEETDLEYKSKVAGLMHACGHDGHVAGLLLTALVLNDLKSKLKGRVRFIFQPAEETYGGAEPMIEGGVLDGVDAAFAAHLWGNAKYGEIGVRSGAIMAAPDEFTIDVVSSGGHGAMPHLTTDSIVVSAQIINNLQNIISRFKDPLNPAVISVCSIQGGSVYNVLPEKVSMKGTVRTFDETLRVCIADEIRKVVEATCSMWNAVPDFFLKRRHPALVNDPCMTALVVNAAAKTIGEKNVKETLPSMGGEDFSYIAEKVPSAYYFVGIAQDGVIRHHSPKFAWDDGALKIYSSTLCQIAIDFLNG
jgi:amidohydrolase